MVALPDFKFLMLEGIVGFLFTTFMINYKKFILNHNKYQDLIFYFRVFSFNKAIYITAKFDHNNFKSSCSKEKFKSFIVIYTLVD